MNDLVKRLRQEVYFQGECNRDVLTPLGKILLEAADELDRLKAELRMVDEAIARRPALADAPDRYTAISRACKRAGEADKAEAERDALKEKYYDLLYQVAHVIPNETRHETARRIIRQHEQPQNQAECAAKTSESESAALDAAKEKP